MFHPPTSSVMITRMLGFCSSAVAGATAIATPAIPAANMPYFMKRPKLIFLPPPKSTCTNKIETMPRVARQQNTPAREPAVALHQALDRDSPDGGVGRANPGSTGIHRMAAGSRPTCGHSVRLASPDRQRDRRRPVG